MPVLWLGGPLFTPCCIHAKCHKWRTGKAQQSLMTCTLRQICHQNLVYVPALLAFNYNLCNKTCLFKTCLVTLASMKDVSEMKSGGVGWDLSQGPWALCSCLWSYKDTVKSEQTRTELTGVNTVSVTSSGCANRVQNFTRRSRSIFPLFQRS